jgi:hypothetical protein
MPFILFHSADSLTAPSGHRDAMNEVPLQAWCRYRCRHHGLYDTVDHRQPESDSFPSPFVVKNGVNFAICSGLIVPVSATSV